MNIVQKKTARLNQQAEELEAFAEALKRKDKALSEVCQAITEMAWKLTDGEWAPADSVLRQMLNKHRPEVVGKAVAVVAKKIDDGRLSDEDSFWVPYLWGTAKYIEQEGYAL